MRLLRACGLAVLAALLAITPGAITGSEAAFAQAGQADTAAKDDAANPQIQVFITQEKKLYGPAARRNRQCGFENSKGEIVVCAADHGEDVRVPSTTDSDPTSREAMRTGVPRAPNVSGLPGCARGCIGIGKGPPPVYIIDLKDIPDAPKGSDAEKVANGEISDR
ncbi:MAG: hypothetical protein ABI673_11480 [Novosphingobium sp.]